MLPDQPPHPLRLGRLTSRNPLLLVVRHLSQHLHRPRRLPSLFLRRTERLRGLEIHTGSLQCDRSPESRGAVLVYRHGGRGLD